MAYEVQEHAGAFVVVNRHTGGDAGLVTPVISQTISDGEDGPGKFEADVAYEMARRFPTRKDAEDWLAKAF